MDIINPDPGHRRELEGSPQSQECVPIPKTSVILLVCGKADCFFSSRSQAFIGLHGGFQGAVQVSAGLFSGSRFGRDPTKWTCRVSLVLLGF